MSHAQGHKHDPKKTCSFKVVASTTFRHRCSLCVAVVAVGWSRQEM